MLRARRDNDEQLDLPGIRSRQSFEQVMIRVDSDGIPPGSVDWR